METPYNRFYKFQVLVKKISESQQDSHRPWAIPVILSIIAGTAFAIVGAIVMLIYFEIIKIELWLNMSWETAVKCWKRLLPILWFIAKKRVKFFLKNRAKIVGEVQ